MNIKRETLNKYIKTLSDAKILYECERFDVKSKKSIRGEKNTICQISLSILPLTQTTASTMVLRLKTSYLFTRASRITLSVSEE